MNREGAIVTGRNHVPRPKAAQSETLAQIQMACFGFYLFVVFVQARVPVQALCIMRPLLLGVALNDFVQVVFHYDLRASSIHAHAEVNECTQCKLV